MTTLLQVLLSGVLLGLIYSAIASGLSLTLGVMGLVNVAHSALAMLAAYLGWSIVQASGIDVVLVLLVVTVLLYFVGVVIERILVRRVYGEGAIASLLSLFGLMIIVESAIVLIWTTTERALPVGYPIAVDIGFLRIGVPRLVAGLVALAATLACHFYLRHSRVGRGIRAMASNRDAASILGIDTARLSQILFGLGTALAATGGVAMAMVFPFTPATHLSWLTLAILVVVIGGLGTIPRTMAAAVVIGIIESLAGTYLPFQYVSIVLYGILIVVLWVRSEGIAGRKVRTI